MLTEKSNVFEAETERVPRILVAVPTLPLVVKSCVNEIFPLELVPFIVPVTVPVARVKEDEAPSVMLVAAILYEDAVIEVPDPIVKADKEFPEDPKFPIKVIVRLFPILTVPTPSDAP